MKQQTNSKKLVMIALFTAFIAVATAFIQFPNGSGGNINAGDAVIFATVACLGSWSVLPAALGSVLGDLLLSYTLYAPATFIIKGTMASICLHLMPRLADDQNRLPIWKVAIVYSLAECIMLAGYFLYELFLYPWPAPLIGLSGNAIQAVFGIIAGSALYPVMVRFRARLF